jgi:hypothetical protein
MVRFYFQKNFFFSLCYLNFYFFIANLNQAYIIKFEEENKKVQEFNNLQEKYDDFQEKYDDLQKKYDDLQEKYDDLTKKYNKEINQNQIIVEKFKNDIEEKYQNQISEINQQNQNSIKSQEQRINQLHQSLELKENKLQNLEKEKEELNVENDNLHQKNSNLINQLEDTLQQNAFLKDDISNENIDQNYMFSLDNDISELNDSLKRYITDLNQDVTVNVEEIKKLLLLYKCPIKITSQKDDQLLIQAVLQRHIIETILSYAIKYFQSTGQYYHLESDIVNKSSSLYTLLTNISNDRVGNDEKTHVTSTKLRQYVYSILNNYGFADIYGEGHVAYEHPFIAYHKEKLNKTMNELRIIKGQEEIASENLAANIICEVIKIFWFRLKIHESIVQYVWIPYNAKIDEMFMEGSNLDDDNDKENLYVGLCYFPLIGSDLTSNNKKVFASAKVFTQRNP